MQGLQQGEYRGVWFEEDVTLLDLYAYSDRSTRVLLASFTLSGSDLPADMREVIDARWGNVKNARRRSVSLRAVDGIPWELHDIDDPEARQEAISAFQLNR